MKKILFTLALFVFTIAGSAQTMTPDGRCMPEDSKVSGLLKVADQVGDFTIVDSDGVSHNLYDALDAGNTVLIDLFFTS